MEVRLWNGGFISKMMAFKEMCRMFVGWVVWGWYKTSQRFSVDGYGKNGPKKPISLTSPVE